MNLVLPAYLPTYPLESLLLPPKDLRLQLPPIMFLPLVGHLRMVAFKGALTQKKNNTYVVGR